ncbi:hypothetical protein GQ457_01G018470 [Hibiscus cannabinus]
MNANEYKLIDINYVIVMISTKSTRIIKRAKFGNSFPEASKNRTTQYLGQGKSAQRQGGTLNNVIFMIKRYCWKLFVLFRIYARNDQPGRMKCSSIVFPAAAEEQIKQEGINRIRIFSNIPKGSVYQRGKAEIKSKSKDLKPKCIKDYLEYKLQPKESCFIKTLCRDLNKPRKSAQAGPVVSCRDIPFVIQFKKIIEAPR